MHFFELQQEARISGENQHSYWTIIQTPHRKATSVIILNFYCSRSEIEQDIYHYNMQPNQKKGKCTKQ